MSAALIPTAIVDASPYDDTEYNTVTRTIAYLGASWTRSTPPLETLQRWRDGTCSLEGAEAYLLPVFGGTFVDYERALMAQKMNEELGAVPLTVAVPHGVSFDYPPCGFYGFKSQWETVLQLSVPFVFDDTLETITPSIPTVAGVVFDNVNDGLSLASVLMALRTIGLDVSGLTPEDLAAQLAQIVPLLQDLYAASVRESLDVIAPFAETVQGFTVVLHRYPHIALEDVLAVIDAETSAVPSVEAFLAWVAWHNALVSQLVEEYPHLVIAAYDPFGGQEVTLKDAPVSWHPDDEYMKDAAKADICILAALTHREPGQRFNPAQLEQSCDVTSLTLSSVMEK